MFLLQQTQSTVRRTSQLSGWLWLVLIGLGFSPLARADELHAEKVLAWEFQRSEDRNNDQWPDGWRRRTGRNFPAYIPVRIQPRDPEIAQSAREAEPVLSRLWMRYQTGKYFKQFIPESTPEPIAKFLDSFVVNNCLTIDMDGGAVELESPAFPLDSRFTYTLEAAVSTRGLDGHRVWIELVLLDGKSRDLANVNTEASTGTTPWHKVTSSSVSSESLSMGQIVVHVLPEKTQRLTGQARIDGIRLYRMPKLELTVNVPYHVATPGQEIDVACHVLGIADLHRSVHFSLIDHMSRLCQQSTADLTTVAPSASRVAQAAEQDSEATKARPGKLTSKTNSSASASAKPVSSANTANATSRMDGVAHWRFKVHEPGYYRIVVDLGRGTPGPTPHSISRETSLAIVDESRAGVGGPFGWSLPEFKESFTPEVVPELTKLGVWVGSKFRYGLIRAMSRQLIACRYCWSGWT